MRGKAFVCQQPFLVATTALPRGCRGLAQTPRRLCCARAVCIYLLSEKVEDLVHIQTQDDLEKNSGMEFGLNTPYCLFFIDIRAYNNQVCVGQNIFEQRRQVHGPTVAKAVCPCVQAGIREKRILLSFWKRLYLSVMRGEFQNNSSRARLAYTLKQQKNSEIQLQKRRTICFFYSASSSCK